MTSRALDMAHDAWQLVGDGVMGGVSSGLITDFGDYLSFRGVLSLAFGGGFASIRRLIDPLPADITAVRISVRGDGRDYQMRLREDDEPAGAAWVSVFRTRPDWRTHTLLLADFEPRFRGRRVPNAGTLDATSVRQVGFLLADGREGIYQLEFRSIEFISEA